MRLWSKLRKWNLCQHQTSQSCQEKDQNKSLPIMKLLPWDSNCCKVDQVKKLGIFWSNYKLENTPSIGKKNFNFSFSNAALLLGGGKVSNTPGLLSSGCHSNQGMSNNTKQNCSLLAAFSGNSPGDQLVGHHSSNMSQSHVTRTMTEPGYILIIILLFLTAGSP